MELSPLLALGVLSQSASKAAHIAVIGERHGTVDGDMADIVEAFKPTHIFKEDTDPTAQQVGDKQLAVLKQSPHLVKQVKQNPSKFPPIAKLFTEAHLAQSDLQFFGEGKLVGKGKSGSVKLTHSNSAEAFDKAVRIAKEQPDSRILIQVGSSHLFKPSQEYQQRVVDLRTLPAAIPNFQFDSEFRFPSDATIDTTGIMVTLPGRDPVIFCNVTGVNLLAKLPANQTTVLIEDSAARVHIAQLKHFSENGGKFVPYNSNSPSASVNRFKEILSAKVPQSSASSIPKHDEL
jgi:hypothetical protein